MIIVFCSPKGGVGKSTSSVLLAAALARAGHQVVLRDLDPDGTATKSAKRFDLTVATASGGSGIEIVDTPPSLAHSSTQQAISNADLVVNVLTLDPADLEKLPGAIPTLLALRAGKPIRTLLNRIPPARTLGAKQLPAVRQQLSEAGLPAFNATISNRMAYAYAHAAGWNALTPDANAEIMAFAVEALQFVIAAQAK
jgi:chromosome partitioning protein